MKVKLFLLLLTVFIVLMFSSCAREGISQEKYDNVVAELSDSQKRYDDLTKVYKEEKEKCEEYKAKYDEYEAIIEPYKDLAEADLLAKTNETNLKAKEDQIELDAIKEQEAVEAAALEAKENKAREAEEKIGYNTDITYDQLARTPDDYIAKKVMFNGQVIQVMEGDGSTQLRVTVDSDYDQILYVEYDSSIIDSRVLEDDIITIYGVSYGLLSYESTMGGTITIPSVHADKIDQ